MAINMKFNQKINIEEQVIDNKSPTFVVAEAGVNHNGSFESAKKLIDIAKESGVNAVKFQAFKTKELILSNVEKAPYQKASTGNNISQFEMLKNLELTIEQTKKLQEYAKSKGLIFLTTPFDEVSLEELDVLNLPAYKISSTDLTNLLFLEKVAKKKRPIFLSCGMSYLSEIGKALKTIYEYNKDVVLMHCTSNYPMSSNEANLNVLNTLRKNFNILLGYSDHSEGEGVGPFTIPMGAKVIEKHFTLDKNMDGPDHKASLSPEELVSYVKKIREVETFLGSGTKEPTQSEKYTRKSLQKSLVASKKINVGDTFDKNNLVAKRTGGKGLSAILINDIVGKKAKKNYEINDLI